MNDIPKDTKVAIIVDPNQSIGFLSNTIATIGVGLGACNPSLGGIDLVDSDNISVKNSSSLPVPILQAASDDQYAVIEKAIISKNKGKSIEIVVFPEFARKLHSFDEYYSVFPSIKLKEEKLAGLGLLGDEKTIKSLTGSLKLLR